MNKFRRWLHGIWEWFHPYEVARRKEDFEKWQVVIDNINRDITRVEAWRALPLDQKTGEGALTAYSPTPLPDLP